MSVMSDSTVIYKQMSAVACRNVHDIAQTDY